MIKNKEDVIDENKTESEYFRQSDIEDEYYQEEADRYWKQQELEYLKDPY